MILVLRTGDEAVLDRVAPDVFDNAIDPRAAAAYLADPRHHIAVAVEDGQVVGFASGVHYFHPDKPSPELFINEVGVSPGYRSRGIGKAVLAALLDEGRALGCSGAWVLTDSDNSVAKRLYTTSGGHGSEGAEVMFDFDFEEPGR